MDDVHPYWDCIVGDYYYYRSQIDNTLNRLSVITGELTTLEPENKENGFFCMDYTVLNDVIYLIGDRSELLKYNYEQAIMLKLTANTLSVISMLMIRIFTESAVSVRKNQ